MSNEDTPKTNKQKTYGWSAETGWLIRVDFARKLERELNEASQWCEIESAPKDGTEILVCGGRWGCESSPCEFEGKFDGVELAEWDDDGDGKYSWCHWVNNTDSLTYYYPTHWMPKPKPFAGSTT